MALGAKLVRWVEGNFRKLECNALTIHTIFRTHLSLTPLHMYEIALRLLFEPGRGELCR